MIGRYDREKLYIVSKVLPGNANRRHMKYSLADTLDRLGTDYLDLYLYHWRGGTPLAETVACLEEAKASGKIRAQVEARKSFETSSGWLIAIICAIIPP